MCFAILNHSSSLWLQKKCSQYLGKKGRLLPKVRASIALELNSNSLEWSSDPLTGIFSVPTTWKTYCPWMDCCHAPRQDCERLHKKETKTKYLCKFFLHLFFCFFFPFACSKESKHLSHDCLKNARHRTRHQDEDKIIARNVAHVLTVELKIFYHY